MAIHLLTVSTAGTQPVDTVGTVRTGETGHFPLGTAGFAEDATLNVRILTTQVGDFPVGRIVDITTTPAQFVARGRIVGIGGVSGSYTNLDVLITSVTTARNADTITNVNLASRIINPVTPGETSVPARSATNPGGGFVQAILVGDEKPENHSLFIRFGSSGSRSEYVLSEGAPVPAGATVLNYSTASTVYNLLLNG